MTKKEKDPFERLSASARRIWLAGLGAIAEAEKRGDEIFESLVESGEGYEKNLTAPMERARGAVEETVSTAKSRASSALGELERLVDRRVRDAMKRMGLVTRADVESLRREVEKLKKAPGPRAPRKKTSREKS
jgi:poly(hydroxyalkanoate) granule-associated protein